MDKPNICTRRDFLQRTVAGSAAITAAGLLSSCNKAETSGKLPKRTLGKTGLEVSMLAFGGGSFFLKNEDGIWEQMMQEAIDSGINLFDTSQSYEWDASLSSEERFGKVLPQYRNDILICTKFDERDPDQAMRIFERSLRRMKTDYVDILMIHSIEPTDDLPTLERGVYKEMVRLKEQGAVRFIGFSSMNSAEKSRDVIENLDMDVVMLAMNPTKYGDYVKIAMPAATRKNMGVIAMKNMRDIVGKEAAPEELLYYNWTQDGVASAVVAHLGLDKLEENIKIAMNYNEKRAANFNGRQLEDRLAHLAGPHSLSWARSDYYDGMMV